jgi:hypothetical protein
MTDVAQLRALLEKMTAPSWEVFVREHPCRFGRNHRENWIVTAWSHGQLKGPVPVAASKVGVGAEGGEPVQMVHINDDDAAGIVALVNAAEPMLDELEALRAEVARLREALEPSGSTKAAYHGEFVFDLFRGISNAGIDQYEKVYVPWGTVKQIMKTIAARAAQVQP